MRARFWHERWQQNQIGFHQDEINPYLQTYWPKLKLATGRGVFVPLCGKSSDMLWLRSQGYPVLGVELSPIAVKDFFAEHGLEPEVTQQGAFELWEVEGLKILLGDFFQLTTTDLAECEAIYDRASLIALPPDMREQYAGHLQQIATGKPNLLITLEYDQTITGGPPFSVTPAEVQSYYAAQYYIELLARVDISHTQHGIMAKGAKELYEGVYLLKPKF
ncbi:thiopurine S-methyltransferase [uncultured Thiothrix sp.]|uniref:thiopurine S-methyltransferase n=1 Tax=uncultured Thiothrix sp. TaxID=223185 RepID=UPI00260BF8FB|nr:thiopurine S-methyltransferase [uncultured Thiothrix sp.]HMT92131.1 thiopurine S-methyltransferase [Thiolinea sp.]